MKLKSEKSNESNAIPNFCTKMNIRILKYF